MKSIKTLRFTKSVIAIALAASGIAASSIAAAQIAATPVQLGTPSGGMVCRSGYGAGFISGTAFHCNKRSSVTLELSCDNPTFPTHRNRAQVAPGFVPNGPNRTELIAGLDICTRTPGTPGAVNIGPTDSLMGLDQSTNGSNGAYQVAKLNAAKVLTRIANQDSQEASALNLNENQVDTAKEFELPISFNTGTAGLRDEQVVRIIFHTFAIPTGGIVGPVATPASTFVPRPLQ